MRGLLAALLALAGTQAGTARAHTLVTSGRLRVDEVRVAEPRREAPTALGLVQLRTDSEVDSEPYDPYIGLAGVPALAAAAAAAASAAETNASGDPFGPRLGPADAVEEEAAAVLFRERDTSISMSMSMSMPAGEASSRQRGKRKEPAADVNVTHASEDSAPNSNATNAAKKRSADEKAAEATNKRAADTGAKGATDAAEEPAASGGGHGSWVLFLFLGSCAVVLGAATLCLARRYRQQLCRRGKKASRGERGADGSGARGGSGRGGRLRRGSLRARDDSSDDDEAGGAASSVSSGSTVGADALFVPFMS